VTVTHTFSPVVLATVGLTLASPAAAGPPFLTDDPVPVEPAHWEAYVFGTRDAAPDVTQLQGPAFELNFGAAPNLQLHLVAPFASAAVTRGPTTHGFGDIEVGVKYRFVQETEHRPQVGIFPMLELPTGDADRGLGNGQLWARLPFWVQKSWGPWTTYGGGGYALNRAPGARDYLFGGWLVQRDLSAKLTLGGEVYSSGADTTGGRGSTIFNTGGYYNFKRDFSLLFSLGQSFSGERHAVAYVALYWTWGPG
jgi:hypothetical protein